jgi:8-oxo-dGTP pyrophosphatase MutT (NUDIX family)
MSRITRYQGAVIHDDQILLIKHRHHKSGREYWVIPGGGREEGETEEECVKREIMEETNLEVVVERLLLDLPGQTDDDFYRFYKTYLCKPITIDAQPGSEPEFETSKGFEISEVGWFSLHNESHWPKNPAFNQFVYPTLKKIQQILR